MALAVCLLTPRVPESIMLAKQSLESDVPKRVLANIPLPISMSRCLWRDVSIAALRFRRTVR